MDLRELIEKHGLNKSHLAEKIGLSKGAFNNKLNPEHKDKFTGVQYVKLFEALKELKVDIDDYLKHK